MVPLLEITERQCEKLHRYRAVNFWCWISPLSLECDRSVIYAKEMFPCVHGVTYGYNLSSAVKLTLRYFRTANVTIARNCLRVASLRLRSGVRECRESTKDRLCFHAEEVEQWLFEEVSLNVPITPILTGYVFSNCQFLDKLEKPAVVMTINQTRPDQNSPLYP